MKNEIIAVIRLLEQMESNLQLRGARGDVTSHPYAHGYRRVYGKSEYDLPEEELEAEDTSPVSVSKAFTKDKKDV